MTESDNRILAGVELGGTKSIALIARGRTIIERCQVATGAPVETLAHLKEALHALQARHGKADALGIAGFGPLRVEPDAPDYGCLLGTPKSGWSGVDIYGALAPSVAGPAAIDTDVNGAALAEGLWGASRGCGVHIYLTIGTGIGGGIVVNGRPVHGSLHPELGHVRVTRDPDDQFPGICPFHHDCLEGLASGPAIAARGGAPAERLPQDHIIWKRVSREIGESIANLILITAAERVVLGGGVGQGCTFLLDLIRQEASKSLASYGPAASLSALSKIIVHPGLGVDAGPLGSIVIAQSALRASVGALNQP